MLLENHFQSNDKLYQAQKERQDRHEELTKHEMFNIQTRQDKLDKDNHDLIARLEAAEAKNDMVFKNKKNLKGSGIVISELLTPARSILLKKCYEHIKGTHQERSIWTDNGRILVKKAGNTNIVNITNEKDLETFVRDFFPIPTTTV